MENTTSAASISLWGGGGKNIEGKRAEFRCGWHSVIGLASTLRLVVVLRLRVSPGAISPRALRGARFTLGYSKVCVSNTHVRTWCMPLVVLTFSADEGLELRPLGDGYWIFLRASFVPEGWFARPSPPKGIHVTDLSCTNDGWNYYSLANWQIGIE